MTTNHTPEILRALKGCVEWMESLRASGDCAHWEREAGDEYTIALEAIAKVDSDTAK